MSSNERSGKAQTPTWWLDRALPILKNTSCSMATLARMANEATDDRGTTWDAAAIAKYKEGSVRTAQLTNALSTVLGIPRPFFTASTESLAIEMALLVRASESGSGVASVDRAGVIEAAVDREFATTNVDKSSTNHVPLEVYGKTEHGTGAGRPRSRRPAAKPT